MADHSMQGSARSGARGRTIEQAPGFGQIGRWQAFVGVGVGTELFALAILLAFFERRGWF